MTQKDWRSSRECARLSAHCDAVGDLCSVMATLLLGTGALILGIGIGFTAPDALASTLTMLLMAFVLTIVQRSAWSGEGSPKPELALED